MVSTHFKNISQIGSFPQVGMKKKNVCNHHPVMPVSFFIQFFEGSYLDHLWFIPSNMLLPTCFQSVGFKPTEETLTTQFPGHKDVFHVFNTPRWVGFQKHKLIIDWILVVLEMNSTWIHPKIRIVLYRWEFLEFQLILWIYHPLGGSSHLVSG